jgi:S-(hydroxymethyl)glutathione dehydrogenase/alcohol dehydrogenase
MALVCFRGSAWAFAETALIHENQLVVVPKDLPFAQAALLGCGVVTGAGSVLNTASVSAGDLCDLWCRRRWPCAVRARIAGASRIIVIDIQGRLEAAQRLVRRTSLTPPRAKPSRPSHSFPEPITSLTLSDEVGVRARARYAGRGRRTLLGQVASPDVGIGLNIVNAIDKRSAFKA